MGMFKDGVVRAPDEVCWKTQRWRSKVDIRWWNEEVKEVITVKEICT